MTVRKRKNMLTTIIIALLLVFIIMIFFNIPYSPASTQFQKTVSEKLKTAENTADVFTKEDIANLPTPVQRYFRYCGYLGSPKMTYMRASLGDVDFVMPEDRILRIDYQQFNLVTRPERYALISSSLYGIPFEGLDTLDNGKGGMRGTLAKIIPLFDQRGEAMDRACLVTWLAECLLVPDAALQDFVSWEPVDDTRAKGTVTWEGVSVSGVFTFAETGELLDFRTSDRTAIGMDGKETKADWSALFRHYHSVNGLLQPEVIQSVWHYEKGDCVYFNQNEAPVFIRYR
ncbi:MAG: DUF6544 family protein [Coriobacteriia bacterium]